MATNRKKATLLGQLILALMVASVPVRGAPYIRLVPVAPQGLTAPPYSDNVLISGDTVYVGSPPQRLWFEIRLGAWGERILNANVPCLLRYVPSVVDTAATGNTIGGTLTVASVLCNGDDAVCANELGPALIPTDHGCAFMNDTQCSAALVNPARRDMFHDWHTCNTWSTTSLGCVSRANDPPGSIADDGGDHYLGTIVIDVPPDARGQYVVGFDHQHTHFSCQDYDYEQFDEFHPATIRVCQPDECLEKNRYVTLSPTTLPPSAASGGIRIRAMEINHQSIANPPPQWVGIPQGYTDPASGQSYLAAELTCTPSVFNWASLPPDALLHVYGANVVPNSRYEIRAGDGFCVGDPDEWDICLSPPTFQRTAAYGDVIEPFGGTGQPNFLDISALVHAFKVLPTAVLKPRAQLAGTVPNPAGAVSFLDIAAGVSAFKGESFPFAGVVYCP